MAKAVAYTLLSTAFIILLINTSLHQHHQFGGGQSRPSFNRRLGFQNHHHVPINFDPLVTKMERESEENDNTNGNIEFKLDESFFFEEGRLNVPKRIMSLFPILDTTPNDGFVDEKELEAWIIKQATERLDHNTKQELKDHDVDGDGFISLSEILLQFSQKEIEKKDMSPGEAGWWMEQFVNADVDRNGLLSFYEFRDFLYPEDSNNEKLKNSLLGLKMSQMDYDHDKKLNLMEFRNGAYGTYKHYSEYERRGASVPSATDVFESLDFNQDGLLDDEELKPMFEYLCPGDLSYAKHYALYLTNAADDNGDGKLTIEEMINNDRVFYDTIYDNEHSHDEL